MTDTIDTGAARMELATAVRMGDKLREDRARRDLEYMKLHNNLTKHSESINKLSRRQMEDLLEDIAHLRHSGNSYGEPITQGQRDFLLRTATNILMYVADHPTEDGGDAYYDPIVAHDLVNEAASND